MRRASGSPRALGSATRAGEHAFMGIVSMLYEPAWDEVVGMKLWDEAGW